MAASSCNVRLTRVAALLTCMPTLIGVGACHRRSGGDLGVHAAAPAPAPPSAARGDRPSDDQLARRFPGVHVRRTPAGGVAIRLLSALVRDGPPLYVIDGAAGVFDQDRGIDWLKPEDIVQIKVLKDPSDTAVYGPRGVNGVILVTTRQALRPR